MTQARCQTRAGRNYTAADLGPFEKLNQYMFSHEGLPFEIEGKVFLNDLLKLTSAEVSMDRFPPGAEGSVVSVAPNGSRAWRSLSDEPLHFIVIQAPAGQYKSGISITDGIAVNEPGGWPSTV